MKKATKFNVVALTIICLMIPSSSLCYRQTAEEQLKIATTELEKLLSSLNMPDDEARERKGEILYARNALNSGYFYLSLYTLQPCWVELKTRQYINTNSHIEEKGIEAFEAEWKRLGAELEKREKLLLSGSQDRAAAAVMALEEISRVQIHPYHQAGRLYGLNTNIANGLYYLGLAPANLDFALFCRGIQKSETGPALKLTSLEPEIARIESETLKLYNQPDASSRQPQYNRVNATLKMAAELNKEGLYEGALQKLLEARLYLYLINKRNIEKEKIQELRERSAILKNRLSAKRADHSIGLLFWEMAQNGLDRAASDESNTDDLKRASVILDNVLPEYFEIVMGKRR